MTDRNRNSVKDTDNESPVRQPSDTYKKLPDQPHPTEDTVSTAGDSANGKYSRTDTRDEKIDNNQVRGGS